MPFYQDKLCLNCLARDPQNAQEIVEVMDGNALIGVLSAHYSTVENAVKDMRIYQELCNNRISVGLGGGNPAQGQMVAELAGILKPMHVNQVFPFVGSTREKVGNESTLINSLVSPTGTPGLVRINTGPKSKAQPPADIPVETAIALIQEMGGSSLKYFPMGGLSTLEEFKAVADACGKANFMLEPTGGLDLSNTETVLKIALDANVPRVIIHVYTSIVDQETGLTRLHDVLKIQSIFKTLLPS